MSVFEASRTDVDDIGRSINDYNDLCFEQARTIVNRYPEIEVALPQHELSRAYQSAVLPDTADSVDNFSLYLKEIAQYPLLNAAQEVSLAKDIEAGLFANHLLLQENDRLARPMQLARLAIRGVEAKQIFIASNLRLVVGAARKMHRSAMFDLPDMVMSGNSGLFSAVERFDFRRGFKFSTFALPWIRKSITESSAENGSVVRIPIHVYEDARIIEAAKSKYQLEGVGEISNERVAEKLAAERTSNKTRLFSAVEALRIEQTATSLDTPLGDDGSQTIADINLGTNTVSSAESIALGNLDIQNIRELLTSALANIDPQICNMIIESCSKIESAKKSNQRSSRNGMQIFDYTALSKKYGLSYDRTRNGIKRALDQLREQLEGKVDY